MTDSKEEYAAQFGRWVELNELVIEDLSEDILFSIADNMSFKGYTLEYWKAEKQKSGHLQIKNIQLPESLVEEHVLKYKELVMKKYIPEKFWHDADWCFVKAKRHRIAEENKPHFKGYGVKVLIQQWGSNATNPCERDLLAKAKAEPIKRKVVAANSGITSQIVAKVSIIEVAKKYGFKVKNNKAVCLFHGDTKPSLSFQDEKGLFYCFGCCKGGNIVEFVALCKTYKIEKVNDNRQRA